MAVAKIIFKLGAKRLSAAQKRALAKAIKASALKRARKSGLKTTALKMKRAKFAVKYGKTVNRLQSAKVKGLRDVNVSRVKLTKRLQAYDALNHPNRLKKSLGLFNEKKAAAAFKKADKEYVRSMIRVGKSSKKVASLQNKLTRLDKKDLKLMASIDRSIKGKQSALKEAQKYAKISKTGMAPTQAIKRGNPLSARVGNTVLREVGTLDVKRSIAYSAALTYAFNQDYYNQKIANKYKELKNKT